MESRFQNRDKRSAIHSVKSQRQSETGGGKYQRYGDKYIQKTIKSETNTSSAGKVNKLLQGQWPKNSIFYFYELWDLETHIISTARDKGQSHKEVVLLFPLPNAASSPFPLIYSAQCCWSVLSRFCLAKSRILDSSQLESGPAPDSQYRAKTLRGLTLSPPRVGAILLLKLVPP